MLKTSIAFFVLSLFSLFLGWRNLGGVSFELGRSLLFAFLGVAFVSFLLSLVLSHRGSATPPA